MIDWQKAFMHYFGLGPLSEILTITNLQEAQEGFQWIQASEVWVQASVNELVQ